MVTLDSRGLRSLTVSELLVGEHGLADMDSPVVDQVDLHDLGTACLEDLAHALADAVVSHVPQVQRLVGVGAAELDHDLLLTQKVCLAVIGLLSDYLPVEVAHHLVHVKAHVHVRACGKSLPVRFVLKGIDVRGELLGKDVRGL